MAVPTTMLLDWEKEMVEQLARNETDDAALMASVLDEMPRIWQGDELDHIVAAAERLVILAHKALERRDERAQARAVGEWDAKDAHPDCP